MKNKYCVLILSCDKYSDLWNPFFQAFWKNWPRCPYPVYLASNTKKYKGNKKVKTILSGDDLDWSSTYRKILDQISEDYIFVWLEDVFILSKINTNLFKKGFEYLEINKAKNIHPRPPPISQLTRKNQMLSIYEKGEPYRINVEGFWNKKYLQKVLIDGESPWNFEILGSYRTAYTDGFYYFNKSIIKYLHVVDKGRFTRYAVAYCKKNGINIDLKKRQVLNSTYDILKIWQKLYVDFIFKIDWRIRLRIMNFLRKLLVCY